MGLPKLDTVEYFLQLPISKVEVKYRPFNVKEQKVLLQAIEEANSKAISNALISLIKACAEVQDDNYKIEQLSNTDLEWIFIHLRKKSVGESTQIRVLCTDESCDGMTTVDVDFDEIKVVGEVKDNVVQLTDNVGVKLRIPGFYDVQEILGDMENKFDSNNMFQVLNKCIVQIFDQDNVYDTKEFTQKEIDEFIDELSVEQFNKVMNWFGDVPKLVYETEFSCEKCGTKQQQVLEGLQNFFV